MSDYWHYTAPLPRYSCEVCGRRTSSIYRLCYADGDVWACGACADLREDEAP